MLHGQHFRSVEEKPRRNIARRRERLNALSCPNWPRLRPMMRVSWMEARRAETPLGGSVRLHDSPTGAASRRNAHKLQ